MTQNDMERLIAEIISGEENSHDISQSDLEELSKLDPEGPYHFVNLLKFKERADYSVGHAMAAKILSGQDAYNIYGIVAMQQVISRGGRLMQTNKVRISMGGGDWDSIATMEYQSLGTFFQMLVDPEYQEALVHRTAGLERTQIHVTRPLFSEPIGQNK